MGTRTDVWALNRKRKDAYIWFPEIKYSFFPFYILNTEPSILHKTFHPGLDFYYEAFKEFNPDTDIVDKKDFPKDNIYKFEHIKGVRPTSGSLTFKYIVDNTKFKSITLVGFDFLKTKNYFFKANDKREAHKSENEETFVMKTVNSHDNISIIK